MAGVLQRFEKRLEGAVTGAFARAFRSAVQPVEIAAALQREIDSNASVLSRDRALVPNDFTIELSPADHERLAPYGATLAAELSALVTDHITEQRYTAAGPIHIEFALDEELRTGRFTVVSTSNASRRADQRDGCAPRESRPRHRWPASPGEPAGTDDRPRFDRRPENRRPWH